MNQAPSLFREGRELAERSRDPYALSQVLNGFGELRARAGAIDEALDLLRESMNRADETEDLGLRVAVRYSLSISLFWGARLRECRAIVEQSIQLAQGDASLGAHRIGLSPSLAASNLHGMILSLTGRLGDGAAELDRVLGRTLPGMGWGPHVFHVLRCEVTGEGASALAHARKAVEHTEEMGNQFGRVASYLSLGLANVLNCAWHDALEALEQALAIGRERRLLAWESSVLARMAAAHLGLGDREKALALAEEAIADGRRRGARFGEFSALLTRIRTLRETQGPQATNEIKAALAEAEAWLEMSGAKSYEPFLHVERAELVRLGSDEATRQRELREAHRLFTEIGAPIRAAEVAKELAG